jgi:hypothetical protein
MDTEFIHEHRAMIAAAEACWRPENPSHSWHVFEWMAYKLRRKYPLGWRAGDFLSVVVS